MFLLLLDGEEGYPGDVVVNVPFKSEYENWNIYLLTLKLTNQDFLCKVFEEYLLYDAIGIIGSVGGTLGICIFAYNFEMSDPCLTLMLGSKSFVSRS